MDTLKINAPEKINKNFAGKIAKLLVEGKIVILPTGTVYGLSCKYDNRDSIGKICKIKKRNKNQPFIILISRPEGLKKLVSDINPAAAEIIKKFWDLKEPKPLTLIFKKNKSLESFITAGSPNIAIRLADTGFLREIINICGPITSTSATISGIKTYPKKIGDIPAEIRKQVDLIVENTSSLIGVESTIVDVTGETPFLVREGVVKIVF
ncbi:MAG: L-threonylcarbamoyladenylate synthase [Actinomycetota bacterium]|nr:L-threonylcarbamoyladenylate synthase [Actinomycetota bacterium]